MLRSRLMLQVTTSSQSLFAQNEKNSVAYTID